MRHKLSRSLLAAFTLSCLSALTACGPKFGDGCKNSTDCSVRNDRICDRSQPGGYCTLANCKPGDCGDDGVCVRFMPDEPRLSSTYCMGKCSDNSDCDRDAYECKSAKALENRGTDEDADAEDEDNGPAFAEVLDGSGDAKFCIVKER